MAMLTSERAKDRTSASKTNSNTKIFVCYHNDQPRIESDVFEPIHVGRALASHETKESLHDCIGDDTGENISYLNKSYCELTALYWAWKNLPPEVEFVGLMHYRRILSFAGGDEPFINWPLSSVDDLFDKFALDSESVQQVCQDNDIVCPPKTTIATGWIYDLDKQHKCLTPEQRMNLARSGDTQSLYDHYVYCHQERDLRATIRSILAIRPEFLSILDESLHDHSARFCNLFVMRRKYFDSYMTFLFEVLAHLEENHSFDDPIYAPGTFQGRAQAFLGERLFSLYMDALPLIAPECRVKELPLVNVLAPTATAPEPPKELCTEPYEIFLSADDHYSHHLAVTLASVLDNADQDESFHFHVLDGGIQETNRFRLETLVNSYNATIKFYELDPEDFEVCPIDKGYHFTLPTYYRFLIPKLTPTIDRALYLDCDLVVDISLREIWNVDLEDNLVAAVEDTWNYITQRKGKFGHKEHEPYFNAGVMVMDLAKCREEGISEQLFEATREMLQEEGKIEYVDQDVLNKVFCGRFKVLPLKWNVQATLFHNTEVTQYHRSELEYARENPAIIHYAGYIKPLDPNCVHPHAPVYFKYLALTPWSHLAQDFEQRVQTASKQRKSKFPEIYRRFRQHPFFSYVKGFRRRVLQDSFKFVTRGVRCVLKLPYYCYEEVRFSLRAMRHRRKAKRHLRRSS